MIGLLRKKHHRLSPEYESYSSDRDERSYYSQEDEQGEDDEEAQPFQDEQYDEDEEEVSQYSDYDDEESIDPELLCSTCNTQTHEYVRKGTILKKWKRMPVENPDVVDEKTGECVACRVSKLKADLLDDLPVLSDSFLPTDKQGQPQPQRSKGKVHASGFQPKEE